MVSTDISRLSLELSQRTYLAAYTLFTPNKSGQRLPPTYYRGCWHVVAGASSGGTVTLSAINLSGFVPPESGLQPEGLLPARGVAASGFRPLRKIPHCCLP